MPSASPAPVVVIIYNRPDFAELVLAKIYDYGPTKLYVVSDGPKDLGVDNELVAQTRGAVDKFDWDCQVVKVYSEVNLGLRERVLSGLDFVFHREQSAIILEDDCLPSATFFDFMVEGITAYQNETQVSLISGSMTTSLEHSHQVFFTHASPIWGWATWRRSWEDFRHNSQGMIWTESQKSQILSTIPGFFARRKFGKFMKTAHNSDSWAIEFSAYNRLRGKIAAVSPVNLVHNIGFGSRSTHTKFESFVDSSKATELTDALDFPKNPKVDRELVLKESRGRLLSWVIYPILHPLDFFQRLARYILMR